MCARRMTISSAKPATSTRNQGITGTGISAWNCLTARQDIILVLLLQKPQLFCSNTFYLSIYSSYFTLCVPFKIDRWEVLVSIFTKPNFQLLSTINYSDYVYQLHLKTEDFYQMIEIGMFRNRNRNLGYNINFASYFWHHVIYKLRRDYTYL